MKLDELRKLFAQDEPDKRATRAPVGHDVVTTVVQCDGCDYMLTMTANDDGVVALQPCPNCEASRDLEARATAFRPYTKKMLATCARCGKTFTADPKSGIVPVVCDTCFEAIAGAR